MSEADLVIRNARLIDGSGAPSYPGDLAVVDDRIAAIASTGSDTGSGTAAALPLTGARVIDAAGLALAPGFIDVHTHDDRALLVDPLMRCKISQGVTSVVAGNCGISLAPLSIDRRPPPPLDLIGERGADFFPDFAAYLAALDADPPALNALCLVGHSSLRVEAMGSDGLDRPASDAETAAMRSRLETALAAGAAGISSGLFYAPASAALPAELTELARAVGAAGGLYATHLRDEADHIVEALQEAFSVGRDAAVRLVLSHHKCSGRQNHGRSQETLALIEAARRRSAPADLIGLDAYPYAASSTVLDLQRTHGASRVIVTWSRAHPDCTGRDLSDIAAEWNLSVEEAADRLQPAGAIYFAMDEADVRRILAYPPTMIGSDGLPHDEHPHPRLWGTFPRVLGRYARDLGLFTLETAVHKMTGLSADRFGLSDRGRLQPGAFADLVLFDPATVLDSGTWAEPARPAAGIRQVFVNGRCVWRDGAATGERPGRALRRH